MKYKNGRPIPLQEPFAAVIILLLVSVAWPVVVKLLSAVDTHQTPASSPPVMIPF